MKDKKITFRDGMWLFGGMLLGIALMVCWLTIGISSAINSIPVNSIQIDLNETQMVETMIQWMNDTVRLPEPQTNGGLSPGDAHRGAQTKETGGL